MKIALHEEGDSALARQLTLYWKHGDGIMGAFLSGWGDRQELERRFQSLETIKSPLKTIIYSCVKWQDAVLEQLGAALLRYPHHIEGEQYLALNLLGSEQKMAAHAIVIPRNGNLDAGDLRAAAAAARFAFSVGQSPTGIPLMPRPVLLAVDDDPDVLRAVERDLRQRYSDRYRVMSADSGPGALDILGRLTRRSEPVALLLADHRMPRMNGIEFLTAAMREFPDARRVLLTAYADTEAAIGAINVVKLDYYLLKPWDPPDQNLYPVLDDLLDEWSASYRPPFEGIRVIGTRWSPRCYEVREFLARHQIPYQWLDIESTEGKKIRGSIGDGQATLPLVVLADGTTLEDPGLTDLANRVGLRTRSQTKFFDLVIVGRRTGGTGIGGLRRFRRI